MSGTGVLIGLAVAAVFTRALRSQLFQVEPIDPLTLGLAASTVVVVTILATWAPAYRASRLNPVAALRHE